MVRTFINVFKNVFDTLNISEHLDVNMCIKHLGKVGVVGYHPSVVIRKAIWSLSKRSTIISPTIDKVTIFALCYLLRESSWITFLAYTVDHVRCIGVFLSHDLCNKHFVTVSKRGVFSGRGSSTNTKQSMSSVVEIFCYGGKIKNRWM
jgi:hypothetical protein